MKMRLSVSALALLGLGASLPAQGAEALLDITLPAIQGGRVKRPYVAIWLERAGSREFAGNIAVWYDMRKPNNVGATKWLPDLRTWWRVSGSQARFPIDGVSGATRPAGEHQVNLMNSDAVQRLGAGSYEVVIEVAREHGGRELLRLPMQWPPRSATQTEASGEREIGAVRLSTRP